MTGCTPRSASVRWADSSSNLSWSGLTNVVYVDYRPSPGTLHDGRRLEVSITAYASRVTADEQIKADRHPNPEQNALIPLPGGLGDDAVSLRALHPALDFKGATASTVVRFDNVILNLAPYYPISDADLFALTRAVVQHAQTAYVSAPRFDWASVAPPSLRPWVFLPSLADLGPDWSSTSRAYFQGQNSDSPLSANQHFKRRGTYSQILESLSLTIATYTTPTEASRHLRDDALQDRAAEQRIQPLVGEQTIVHASVHTTSEQYVLGFRRGRFDVEIDLTEAPDTVSDHAVAIARRVDARLLASGGGLP